jgi:hypothetical protein
VVFDPEDFGHGTLHGLAALRDLSRASNDDKSQPPAHHVTNVIVTGLEGHTVRARSKALPVMPGGTSGTAVHENVIRRDEHRRRISHRKVIARTALRRSNARNILIRAPCPLASDRRQRRS